MKSDDKAKREEARKQRLHAQAKALLAQQDADGTPIPDVMAHEHPTAKVLRVQKEEREEKSKTGAVSVNVLLSQIHIPDHAKRHDSEVDIERNEAFAELCKSIKEIGKNTTPITLRRIGGNAKPFELVAGYRRVRALAVSGMTWVQATVYEDMTDEQSAVFHETENTARADKSLVSRGKAYAAWLDMNWFESQADIARACKTDAGTVSIALDLHRMFPAGFWDRVVDASDLGRQRAKAILAAAKESPDLLAVLNELGSIAINDVVEALIPASPKSVESDPKVIRRGKAYFVQVPCASKAEASALVQSMMKARSGSDAQKNPQ